MTYYVGGMLEYYINRQSSEHKRIEHDNNWSKPKTGKVDKINVGPTYLVFGSSIILASRNV